MAGLSAQPPTAAQLPLNCLSTASRLQVHHRRELCRRLRPDHCPRALGRPRPDHAQGCARRLSLSLLFFISLYLSLSHFISLSLSLSLYVILFPSLSSLPPTTHPFMLNLLTRADWRATVFGLFWWLSPVCVCPRKRGSVGPVQRPSGFAVGDGCMGTEVLCGSVPNATLPPLVQVSKGPWYKVEFMHG